jgi:FSR family fosmidomycin resistance protein-like MFS transporter
MRSAARPAPRSALLALPRERLFWSVALGHLTNDIFMNLGPVSMVFIASLYSLDAVQLGLALGARDAVSALSQPLFGWLSDRLGGRWLAPGGVAWLVTLSMVTFLMVPTGRYWLVVLPYALSALGSGAFHPVGVTHATTVDTTRQAGNAAYFFLFGQTGLALGPTLAGFLLDQSGRALQPGANPFHLFFALPLIALPALFLMASAIPNRPNRPAARPREGAAPAPASRAAGLVVGPLLLVATLLLLRSIANFSTVNFIPVLFERKGWSPTQYGLITSSFWIASAVSGVILGQLADRFDRRLVIAGSLALAAPAMFILPLLDGAPAFALAIASGGFVGGSFSIIVVIAQSLIPVGKGLASGLILGFAFFTGALGNPLIGVLADGAQVTLRLREITIGGIGLERTFQVVAGLALLAALLALLLPKREETHV